MIETIGSGIKKIFQLQQERYLPLPDYYMTDNVEVILTGKVLNNEYSRQLIKDKNLDLSAVFILDKIQKGIPVNDADYQQIILAYLRINKRAKRDDINNLLVNILNPALSEKQKYSKIKNILSKLSKEKIIENISTSRKSAIWVLK